MKMKTRKVLFMTVFFVLSVFSILFADSTQYMANVMSYGKWVVGIVAGIVTLSAVGYLMWGLHLRNAGDMKGDAMVKNAIWTIVICAVAWALLGAFLFKGAEMQTGVNNITNGWQ
jgi:hypothetical protein